MRGAYGWGILSRYSPMGSMATPAYEIGVWRLRRSRVKSILLRVGLICKVKVGVAAAVAAVPRARKSGGISVVAGPFSTISFTEWSPIPINTA